jgi:Probable zinc-ribbon domain
MDKRLHCVKCGDAFILSAGEQELYSLRGVPLRTTLCPGCVRDRVYGVR